tara:strand:- start:239 stop:1132 length:894 start_codon:yes stop_codon:yes gene_type:complete
MKAPTFLLLALSLLIEQAALAQPRQNSFQKQMLQCRLCAKQFMPRCGNDPYWRFRLAIINNLCQSWTYSHEQGNPSQTTGQIFRPLGSPLLKPGPRGSVLNYVFYKNDDFVMRTADGHCGLIYHGTWHLAKDNRTIHWKHKYDQSTRSFQILEVTKNILRISSSKIAPPKAVWLTDLAKAKAQAAKEGKLILMEFTGSDWCGPCIALEKNVLSTDTFKQNIPGKFVLLKLDTPRDKSRQTPQEIAQYRTLSAQYKVRGVPTIIVTDPTGNERHRQVGYSSRQSAQQWVSSMLKVAGP